MELRQGVKWHDGCSFKAEDVIWNLDRIANEKAPQFHPKQFAMIRNRTSNIEKIEAVNDYKIVMITQQPDALLPYQLSYWFMISRCKLEALNYDYEAYQKAPSGTGPYQLSDIRGTTVAMIFQEPMTALDPVYTVGQQIAETVVRHDGGRNQDGWLAAGARFIGAG